MSEKYRTIKNRARNPKRPSRTRVFKSRQANKSHSPNVYDNVEDTIASMINKGVDPGAFCTDIDEPVPVFRRGKCEKVIKTPNNSFIVMGRDRPGSLASGAGGKGMTQCGMIDLVVGRGASYSSDKKLLGPRDMIGPSFAADAARVYITQKSLGIDDYFGIENKKTDSYGKSAVALKADHLRIIGREHVRIFAGAGRFTKREKNANGTDMAVPRIDLVATHESNLQPAVLGNNLAKHLKSIQSVLRDILGYLKTIFVNLAPMNGALAGITFGSPPFSTNITGNITSLMSMITHTISAHMEEINALDKAIMPGNRTILSNAVFIS